MSDFLFRTDDELDVARELGRATEKFGPMASPHEAVAVIEEEFLEFREAVFWRRSDPRTEAIQLAAMVLRYLRDCDPPALSASGETEADRDWQSKVAWADAQAEDSL